MNIITHFLDSNVILGIIIEDDGSYNDSKKYFDLNFENCASDRVYKECDDVLNDNKTRLLTFLKRVNKDKISKNLELLRVIQEIASESSNNPDVGDRITKSLIGFCVSYKEKINDMIKGNEDYKVFRRKIIDAYKMSQERLDIIFKNKIEMKKCHPAPAQLFSQKQSLQAEGVHNSDFLLLADAFYIQNTDLNRGEYLAFLTFDKTIIQAKSTIEEEFIIHVSNPRDYTWFIQTFLKW